MKASAWAKNDLPGMASSLTVSVYELWTRLLVSTKGYGEFAWAPWFCDGCPPPQGPTLPLATRDTDASRICGYVYIYIYMYTYVYV